jgi:hypothetical protein
VTDHTGRSFLSYRRGRHLEAALLVAAQWDFGIPTWQDVQDLAQEPLEPELRRVLADPTTANAILWITPEVAESAVIRGIEVPQIVRRYEVQDGFFVIPVVAGGLGYEGAARVLGRVLTVEDFRRWNMVQVNANPIGPTEARDVAIRVLQRRLETLHGRRPAGEHLRMSLHTRAAPAFVAGVDLAINWAHRFNGREATAAVWREYLLPALRAVSDAVLAHAPARHIDASGLPSIPAAIAFGAAFLQPRGIIITWKQTMPNNASQDWSLTARREQSGVTARTEGYAVGGQDLAVLVSVAASVEEAFVASRAWLPQFRAITRVRRPGGGRFTIDTPGQAVDVAQIVIEAVRDARREYSPLNRVHLFAAVPVGVGAMIGQLLNTLGDVQTYEHIPVDLVGRYHPAVALPAGA